MRNLEYREKCVYSLIFSKHSETILSEYIFSRWVNRWLSWRFAHRCEGLRILFQKYFHCSYI